LGVRLPLLPLGGMAELARQRVANAQAASAPLAGSSPAASAFRSGVVESVRRATVTRERQVRALPPEPHAPVVENGDDAGLSTRKLRVRVPPGVLASSSGCRGAGHPTGFGRRRPQVRLLPARYVDLRAFSATRGRGGAVLASLMSSRSWVRIPPALPRLGGVAQLSRALACQARGCRFESGRPRSWWPWCNGEHPRL
jgi:hypothetical protein